ncbi:MULTISPECIES: STAS domain-containing protein [Actinomadura]|uniref:STAS domain-containing protein n=1 Tax=Actinomadura yumaensis TaxID=111807 RepID=A0ABW2CRY0_9ACTN|nr:STAS domain-containing protein [Actinomadura sp. J1-007]MWK34128.1 STAS domain-containing protein [Actinomadura sp. J1-007]
MDGLSLSSHYAGDALTVTVAGDLDLIAARRLLSWAEESLARFATPDGERGDDGRDAGERFSQLVVEVSGVAFIDAAGLGALVALQNRAARHQVQVLLKAAPAPVQRLLALTRMQDHFTLR